MPRRKYFCEDCNDYHDIEPKRKRSGSKGWKVIAETKATDNAMAVGQFLNQSTKEVIKVKRSVTERFILRSGANKGKPIFRTTMDVVRG